MPSKHLVGGSNPSGSAITLIVQRTEHNATDVEIRVRFLISVPIKINALVAQWYSS